MDFTHFQVSVFGGCSPEIQEIAYQYGKNIGMAFQVCLQHFKIINQDVTFVSPNLTSLVYPFSPRIDLETQTVNKTLQYDHWNETFSAVILFDTVWIIQNFSESCRFLNPLVYKDKMKCVSASPLPHWRFIIILVLTFPPFWKSQFWFILS